MIAGQSYPVSVTMKNTGSMTWNEASMIRLGAVGDGTGDAVNSDLHRIKIPCGNQCPPGGTVYVFLHDDRTCHHR